MALQTSCSIPICLDSSYYILCYSLFPLPLASLFAPDRLNYSSLHTQLCTFLSLWPYWYCPRFPQHALWKDTISPQCYCYWHSMQYDLLCYYTNFTLKCSNWWEGSTHVWRRRHSFLQGDTSLVDDVWLSMTVSFLSAPIMRCMNCTTTDKIHPFIIQLVETVHSLLISP